ncbi:MAG: GlxA family transcriptional regulator [Pseudomonadota bacterium]
MSSANPRPKDVLLFVTPHFNISATTSFVDPFRVANYLSGTTRFSWRYVSEPGGMIESSSGVSVETLPLNSEGKTTPWLAMVSSSWAPEQYCTPTIKSAFSGWQRRGALIAGLDTGGILLAEAGLLRGRKATVHYEHIDAFIEIAPETEVSEDLIVFEDGVVTCCGGSASTDLGLRLVHDQMGESVANACARYLFHHELRGAGASQNPKGAEPLGYVTPSIVRAAIDLMEAHLEVPLSIPEIARQLGKSQRQLARLFQTYVRKSPVEYYRDIRLDRARGLVTQTELKLSEVAAASGFNSQIHFSRAYTQRFGLSPSKDRIAGRVPFEFRAWPMHERKG